MLERRPEVLQVDSLIGHQEELRQRQLPFAEDPKGAGHRFARVALLHDGGGQRVITRFAVGPELLDGRHDHWKQRRQQFLQQIADEEVLLSRLPDHGGRKDGVVPPGDTLHVKNRIVVLQRVIAVVVAEWPFRPTGARRHRAHQGELGASHQGMRPRALDQPQSLAGDERRQHQLRHVLRQRGNGRQNQRRRAAQKDRDGQGLAARLRHGVVKPAAFTNLPVHAGRSGVVHLQAIHTEVVPPAIRMFSEHERQGDERAPVLRPRGQRRQSVQPDIVGDDIGHRSPAAAAQTNTGQLANHVPGAPQRSRGRRQRRLQQFDESPNQPLRALAEGQFGASGGAEQICDQRKVRIRHVPEQEGRTTGGYHPAMDLRGLLCPVHARGDLDEITVVAEAVQKDAQIGKGHQL